MALYRRILIVAQADAASRAAVAEGVELARTQGAEALFLAVLPAPAVALSAGDILPAGVPDAAHDRRHADARAARLLAAATAAAQAQGVSSQGAVAEGEPLASAVAGVAVQRGCDLIVVGADGRSALQRFIHGSLAASLLAVSPVPLLVCRWQGDGAALGEEDGGGGGTVSRAV